MKNIYITFHINYLGGFTPIAVKCSTTDEANDVLADVMSLHSYSHVNINKSGRFRKDSIVVSWLDYWDYQNHDKWVSEYRNRFKF